MKNMVLLIDTNILINFLTKREDPFGEESEKIVELCAIGKCTGYIAFHTLSTLWYVLRKHSDEERRRGLKAICGIFNVVSASQKEIFDAIENKAFTDFEDCLQDKCAKEAGADYIVTCNIGDFANSEILAITPKEFLKLISLVGDSVSSFLHCPKK